MASKQLLLALAALAFSWGCASAPLNFDPVSGRPLALSSDPPGARIAINNEDSGWVTPCVLDVDEGRSHVVQFTYPGYEPAIRILDNSYEYWTVLWREMYTHEGVWRFPLWLGFEDFLLPVKFERGQSPSRVFVRLKRSADQ